MKASPANAAVKIICTLGPASTDPAVIAQLDELGVDLFRINMSHTPLEKLRPLIRALRRATRTPLCLDTEGAQVRTAVFRAGVVKLETGAEVALAGGSVPGDERTVPINPPEFFSGLREGTLVSLDFNAVLLMVTGKVLGHWRAKVLCGGLVGTNKGVSVDREPSLPAMTRKDLSAIAVARAEGIRHFAFSFASSAAAVRALQAKAGPGAVVISKIESRVALRNADEIMAASEAVLIDRGDLSREVPVERLPLVQKRLIAQARGQGVPIYIATNLLESMIASPHPTRAEVNDIVCTLMDGANGLVLAAETAIGRYPVRAVRMVRRLVNAHASGGRADGEIEAGWLGNGMLENRVPPNGGRLVQRLSLPGAPARARLPKLAVSESTLRDLDQIAHGAYSPLTGFMGREEIHSVLDSCRLPDGTRWTLPIVLPVPAAKARFSKRDRVLLQCPCCPEPAAWLEVSDVYAYDPDRLAKAWFGTDDRRHPGLKRLLESGDRLAGGKITLLRRHALASPEHALTPIQTRAIFAHNGWDKVVGFHTRNAPHRAHEFIQMEAMSRTGADGILLHPALGRKKPGDFSNEAILAAYAAHMKRLPRGRAILSGFFSDSWYAGPREAVFTALCRRNFGCSHFIVGRDHTGVGSFYAPDAPRRLFEELGDIGIQPIFFDQVVYRRRCNRYEETSGGRGNGFSAISGTEVRRLLLAGRKPPEWMMRRPVAQALLGLASKGKDVFHRG